MQIQKYLAILLVVVSFTHVYADELSGTWKYEKASEYFDANKKIKQPENITVQILNGKLSVSSRCFLSLTKEKFLYSTVFQGFLKQGIDKQILDQ
ncbi:MAG: hypothetical protein V4447_11680 [Pseudomonadota bacterium]